MSATSDQQLRKEFNDWARQGRGESMARHHHLLLERVLERLRPQPGDRILDLGCGSGWASRRLAEIVGPSGSVLGVDVSDEMIRAAESQPHPPHLRFLCAAADRLPVADGACNQIVSIESFYYYPDLAAVLAELHRVSTPGAGLFIIMCLFRGSPQAQAWMEKLAVPVHCLSAEEYLQRVRAAGWEEAQAERFAPEPGGAAPDEHAHALLVQARRGSGLHRQPY